jgi:hypothetical protein
MNTQPVSIYGMLAVALLLMNAVILETALVKNADWYKALWVTLPLLALAIYQHKKKKMSRVKKTVGAQGELVFDSGSE